MVKHLVMIVKVAVRGYVMLYVSNESPQKYNKANTCVFNFELYKYLVSEDRKLCIPQIMCCEFTHRCVQHPTEKQTWDSGARSESRETHTNNNKQNGNTVISPNSTALSADVPIDKREH